MPACATIVSFRCVSLSELTAFPNCKLTHCLRRNKVANWNTNDARNFVNPKTGDQGKFHPIQPSNASMFVKNHARDAGVRQLSSNARFLPPGN